MSGHPRSVEDRVYVIRDVTIPMRLVSLTNQREHWAVKARRAKSQRMTTRFIIDHGPEMLATGMFLVTLTRVAPRELDDDNLRAACKSVRDGVADWLGIDDGDTRIEWRYEQAKGKPKEHAVRILIERLQSAIAEGCATVAKHSSVAGKR